MLKDCSEIPEAVEKYVEELYLKNKEQNECVLTGMIHPVVLKSALTL